jgi:hypothetical protein
MWNYRKFCAISYLKSSFPLQGCFNAKNACVNVDHPKLNEDEPVIFSLHRKILPRNDRTGYPIPIDGPGIRCRSDRRHSMLNRPFYLRNRPSVFYGRCPSIDGRDSLGRLYVAVRPSLYRNRIFFVMKCYVSYQSIH